MPSPSLGVANDLAFLAMDFALPGRPDFARRLVEQVAEPLEDPELDALIRLTRGA